MAYRMLLYFVFWVPWTNTKKEMEYHIIIFLKESWVYTIKVQSYGVLYAHL